MSDEPVRWSSKCDLCRNTRVLEFSGFRGKPDAECPWCRAVRLKYGSYLHPVVPLMPKSTPSPVATEDRVREIVAAEIGRAMKAQTPQEQK